MHVYPLRSSRNYWKIPLYCCHECGANCQTKFTVTNDGTIDIIPNPLYDPATKKCNKYDTLCPATIPIHSYDLQFPSGMEGKLYYPDLVVIPDLSFTIFLNFPFTTNVEIAITCEQAVTLRELLQLIKSAYIQIYQDEEKTADSTVFTITRTCKCIDVDLKERIEQNMIEPQSENTNDCSVCYMPLESSIVQLPCQHLYHKECILGWIEKGSGLNCPLCRKPIHPCDDCNGEQMITTEEEHIVLPADLREVTMNRNTTNGIYGIYSHDLENLYITEIKYNRIMKILQVSINV